MHIEISKFKKIDKCSVELGSINIFIGSNNSGKSSFIQGIQFAVSASQTLELHDAVWKTTENRTLSFESGDFLYTPTKEVENLYHNQRLTRSETKESKREIKFSFKKGRSKSEVSIYKNKNGGLSTSVNGKALGEKIASIDKPFCVYIPGLAGIPIQEKYEVPVAVRKSAIRGDSNNYLRNILLRISKKTDGWKKFLESVNRIYGGNIDILVLFDEEKSEFIEAIVKIDGVSIPIDSLGNGLLQVIQIFAYIEYFEPQLILLDEPDSHLHPSKQRKLAAELVRRSSEDSDLKIIFSTHSRYILDELEGKSKVFHFKDGKVISGVKDSAILLDIGAIDAELLFGNKRIKYIVATEDLVDNISDKKNFLRSFLISNGLSEDEFVLHSYEGCTKVHFAKILESFARKHIPNVKIILHIDRDQKTESDRELIKLKESCVKNEISLFVTEFQEIENYFCQPEHIKEIFGIKISDYRKVYNRFVRELRVKTERKVVNFILNEREELSIDKKSQRQDIDLVNDLARQWIDEYGDKLTLGKELMGKVKSYLQKNKKIPEDIVKPSSGLISKKFQELIGDINE